MNVLYTCDNNYAWLMGISMISLFDNNKKMKHLTVYLLGENISNENKLILQKIASNYQREIHIIDVPELDIPEILVSRRWPLSAFTRLFSGQLLPEAIDKVLYLDCDTIISGSIQGLEDFSMDGATFCGVKDCIGKTYKKNIGLSNETLYINAGVVLIDLQKLRNIPVSVWIYSYLKKYTSYINYADQDLLNGVFRERIGVLQPEYNVMTLAAVNTYEEIITLRKPTNFYSKDLLQHAVQNPKIIHYTTNMLTIRPWYNNTDHPFAHEFTKYFKTSPWKDRTLNSFTFITKESKTIKAIRIFPTSISNKILGIIHSELKPRYIRLKAKRKHN